MKKFNQYMNELAANTNVAAVPNAVPNASNVATDNVPEEQQHVPTPQELKWYLNKITTKLGSKANYFAPLFRLIQTKPIAVKLLSELIDQMGGMSAGQAGQLQAKFQQHVGQ